MEVVLVEVMDPVPPVMEVMASPVNRIKVTVAIQRLMATLSILIRRMTTIFVR